MATAGGSGSFNILIQDTDLIGSAPYNVASDVIQVGLSGLANVHFTAATIDTTTADIGLPTATYLYVDSGTLGPPASPLSYDTFPNTSFTASDSEFNTNPDYRAINPGDTFGLVHVSYTVDSLPGLTSPLIGTIGISPESADSSLADDQGNPIDFTTRDGTFTILPAAVVPEPATLISSSIGLACAGAYAWRRRRLASV